MGTLKYYLENKSNTTTIANTINTEMGQYVMAKLIRFFIIQIMCAVVDLLGTSSINRMSCAFPFKTTWG